MEVPSTGYASCYPFDDLVHADLYSPLAPPVASTRGCPMLPSEETGQDVVSTALASFGFQNAVTC